MLRTTKGTAFSHAKKQLVSSLKPCEKASGCPRPSTSPLSPWPWPPPPQASPESSQADGGAGSLLDSGLLNFVTTSARTITFVRAQTESFSVLAVLHCVAWCVVCSTCTCLDSLRGADLLILVAVVSGIFLPILSKCLCHWEAYDEKQRNPKSQTGLAGNQMLSLVCRPPYFRPGCGLFQRLQSPVWGGSLASAGCGKPRDLRGQGSEDTPSAQKVRKQGSQARRGTSLCRICRTDATTHRAVAGHTKSRCGPSASSPRFSLGLLELGHASLTNIREVGNSLCKATSRLPTLRHTLWPSALSPLLYTPQAKREPTTLAALQPPEPRLGRTQR